MKITGIETMRCDAGWRTFSFLKITTDEGLVGWSEYNESFGSAGLSAVIEALGASVIGKDPGRIEWINAHLRTQTVQSRGGINRQAVAALENALLDIKGKALGVPVYELFGGAVSTRIPVYCRIAGAIGRAIRSFSVCHACRPTTISPGWARKSSGAASAP